MGRQSLLFSILFVLPLSAESGLVSLRLVPPAAALHGADSSQQFVVTAVHADGSEKDVTHLVQWKLSEPSLAAVDATGLLEARHDGKARLAATLGGRTAEASVEVTGVAETPAFQFSRNIGNILTKKGCNGASCHGGVKGRGGFKLSAGALHPKDDYEWIVKGGAYQVLTAEVKGERIPRISTKEPEQSLILRKATGSVPHGGGRRFKADSPEYRVILDWIRNGAPYGPETVAQNQVKRLEVYPSTAGLEADGQQRLLVTAHFADGRSEDFTHQALYISNNRDVAGVDESGLVTAKGLGETAILIRAAGQAVTATIGVMGPAIPKYPNVAVSNFIDQHIFDKMRRFRIMPSPISSDAEFLRRVCLDLTGTLPPPSRVREFLASKDPDKRTKLIDTLMATPEFVDYWTFRFDDLFRTSVNAQGVQKWSDTYAEWLRDSIAKNKPYDQMAHERIAAQGYNGANRHYLPYQVTAPINETVAEEVRVFFGRRMDCAQCHNHPYETWSQDQFWGLAAFFSRTFKMGDNGDYVVFDHPNAQVMGNRDVDANIKVLHPRTKVELKPALLDGTVVDVPDNQNPRQALADWMVKHPYFAEAIVNRMWANFFGRGIVDPVDDFRSTNPPTHPELLADLAENFRKNGHDLRKLILTIVKTRAYQLSSEAAAGNAADRTNYSHALARPLDAEVLLDAICNVTGVPEVYTVGVPDGTRAPRYAPAGTRAITLRQPETFYARFLDIYGRPNRLTLPERSGKANLRQALHMLAGSAYNDKIAAANGRLSKLIQAGKKDSEIIEEFYLAALSRSPDAAEQSAFAKLIAERGDRTEGLRDFLWALLCSREFAENH